MAQLKTIFQFTILLTLGYFWIRRFYHQYFHSYPSQYEDYWSGLTSFEDNKEQLFDMAFIKEPLTMNDLEYFIHVSDLHIDDYHLEPKRNFLEFLDETIPLIRPLFLAVTGDLTDGKDQYSLTSRQNLPEWEYYYSQLQARNYTSKGYWLDIPGNHDRFCVYTNKTRITYQNSILLNNSQEWIELKDYYKIYGVQKMIGWRQTIQSDKIGDIHVIGIDGCPYPGPPRPYNFFGYITSEQMNLLESQLAFDDSVPSLHKIVLSHYPVCTSTFSRTTKGKSFGDLSKGFGIYLCGHLHNLVGGLGRQLLRMSETGFAELEIGDLKLSKNFRVLSISKDRRFAFSDHSQKEEVYLHVIEPKDARFLLRKHEKLDSMRLFIEFLVFPKINLKNINVFIDDANVPLPVDFNIHALKTNPLVTVPFDYSKLDLRVPHELKIEVIDDKDQLIHTYTQPFTLNGRRLDIKSAGNKILGFRFIYYFKISLFIAYLLIFLFILILPRLYSSTDTDADKNPPEGCQRLIESVKILNHDPLFFYSWLAYCIYTPIFPLFIGPLIPKNGYLYSFYVVGFYEFGCPRENDCWLPVGDTWEFSSVYMFAYILPQLSLLLYKICRGEHDYIGRTLIGTLWMLQFMLLGLLWINYGMLAFVLSPGISWFFALNFYLYYCHTFINPSLCKID